MRKGLWVLGVFGVLALMLKAWTCGYGMPETFLIGHEPYILAMPRVLLFCEWERTINPQFKQFGFKPIMDSYDAEDRYNGSWDKKYPTQQKKSWDNTLNAEQTDLHEALSQAGILPATADVLLMQYDEMRRKMKPEPDPNYYWEPSIYSLQGKTSEPIDVSSYKELLTQIPKEFALYAKGAAYYRAGRFSQSEAHWQELLALPPEQRPYRTTWAFYMMGKASLVQEATHTIPYFETRYQLHDAAQAKEYFLQTQKAAQEGFKDSLNLAQDSEGWIAHVEMQQGDYKNAINRYYKLAQMPDGHWQSLEMLCLRLARDKEVNTALIEDEISRKVITAWILSRKNAGIYEGWLDAIEKANLILSVGEMDRLAWIAYRRGRFEQAKAWLAKFDIHTPEGKWVQSKMLLRDGKINEAMTILRELVPVFGSKVDKDVLGSLGVLHLGQQEYVEALDAFLRSDYWIDAAYLADYIVDLKDLEKYCTTYKGNNADKLRNLLSRRFARNQQWDKAREFGPVSQLSDYVEALQKAENTKLSKKERVEHYFKAAFTLRHFGMEIMGTETEPDWFEFEGVLDRYGPSEARVLDPTQVLEERQYDAYFQMVSVQRLPSELTKLFFAGPDEKERVMKNLPTPNKRFHYRYVAAELLWKCSKLLPDNDPKLAEALYTGGMYLEKRDPQAADKFYKALVRRCKKLAIGKEADRRHWFPDTVMSFETTE